MAPERQRPVMAAPPEAARTLAIASRLVERSLGEMTLPQMRVLSLVARAPERASRLASQSDVSRPTLTGVLDGLEAKGWIRRTEVEGDRRGVELEATAGGRHALADAQRAVADRLDEVLALIEPERRAQALAGLDALGEALHAHIAARSISPAVAHPPAADPPVADVIDPGPGVVRPV